MATQRSWAARIGWWAAGLVILLIVLVAAGWAVWRQQTPVSVAQAVEHFRAANDDIASGRYEVEPNRSRPGPGGGPGQRDIAKKPGAARVPQRGTLETQPGGSVVAAAVTRHFDVMPAEGVYRYEGSGMESLQGLERNFPTDTERIIWHEDRDTWTEHHIFSEERESWTLLTTSESGRLAHHQRNDIKIGTGPSIDESRTISFTPPLQATLFPPTVGATWDGEFSGTTEKDESYTGTYRVRMIEDDTWTIGGVRSRVLGYDMDVEFEGEVAGTVRVKYWFAPRHGLTVRENYSADAKVGPLSYHGEWFVRLKSLSPVT